MKRTALREVPDGQIGAKQSSSEATSVSAPTPAPVNTASVVSKEEPNRSSCAHARSLAVHRYQTVFAAPKNSVGSPPSCVARFVTSPERDPELPGSTNPAATSAFT